MILRQQERWEEKPVWRRRPCILIWAQCIRRMCRMPSEKGEWAHSWKKRVWCSGKGCYKRVGSSYIYKVVKAMALKQVFQGKYIEHEISIRWEHSKWVHSLIYLLNSFHRVNQWTEAALHSVFHGPLLHDNRKPPPKNHHNNAFSLRRVWEMLLPQDLSVFNTLKCVVVL